MKGFFLAVALVFASPLAAFAHSTCSGCLPYIGNLGVSGGTFASTTSGFTLTGGDLTEIRGISGADLGTVTMTTGSLWGDLIIALNPGVLGGKLSGGGILFNGSFLAPVSFTYGGPGGPGYYLQGTAYGILPNGTYGQAFVGFWCSGSFTSNGFFQGTVSGGIDVVPEPGTLGLFAAGLIGMGGAIRRKLRA